MSASMVPRFPQELFDLIFDYCDHDTLHAVSVGHSSWLVSARRRLFREVSVDSDEGFFHGSPPFFSSFEEVVEGGSSIALAVQDLSIGSGTIELSRLIWVLGELPRLRKLSINYTESLSTYEALPVWSVPPIQHLQELTFRECLIPLASDVLEIIKLCRLVDRVAIYWLRQSVHCLDENRVQRTPRSPTTRVLGLCYHDPDPYEDEPEWHMGLSMGILDGLMDQVDLRSVRSIEFAVDLNVTFPTFHERCAALIAVSQSHLEELLIRFTVHSPSRSPPGWRPGPVDEQALDLSSCTQLRSLALHLRFERRGDDKELVWADTFGILRSIPPGNPLTLTVDVRSFYGEHILDDIMRFCSDASWRVVGSMLNKMPLARKLVLNLHGPYE